MNFASHMMIIDREPGEAPLQIFLIGMNYLIAEKLMSIPNEEKQLELMAGHS